MPAIGTKNQGIIVRIGTQLEPRTGDVYQTIGRCKIVAEFGPEAPAIDTTALEDTVKEKIKGTPDVGTLELSGNRVYTNAGQNALAAAALLTDDVPFNFIIRARGVGLPGEGNETANKQWLFKGIVSKFREVPGAVDGIVEFAATVAITGAITESTYVG